AGAPEPGEFLAVYGTPIYLANVDYQLRTVKCSRFPCGVQGVHGEDTKAMYKVPIPAAAQPDPSDDGHLVVYDPGRGISWEFFRARYIPEQNRWLTQGGIRWDLAGLGFDT